nr:putative nucleotidyltransferase, ribonuclease H [Tanacetum cinerariifolium]
VPNDASLREALLTEAHSSPFSKQHFWWSGMKRDVATFVSRCLICQQVKIEHQRASGLLQPLDIPVWKWDKISMDFVTGFPRTQRRYDAIWVVVDRLTKSAHFLPIRKDYSVSRLAEIFQQEIVRLHGTLSAIVLDRDPRFASCFWKGLKKAWGTRLKFSTAFHPQTDGNWDDYICLVEFAYNNSWHASIKCAPFEMLYGRKCHAPIYWDQVGERVIKGLEMIEVTNNKFAVANEKLKEARTHQKSYADKHHRSLEFQPGDHVFLKLSPARGVRRFGIKGKLSPRFIGPFEILDRVGERYKYHPLHVISYPLDQIRANLSYVEEPEAILDRRDRVMRKKTIPFIKILWRNHPEREATWETEERFGIKGKLSPRFIGPFEILDCIGEVSYRLALPPQLSHVHNVFYVSLLRGYKYHPLHVISYLLDQIRADLSYVEEPEAILDRQDRVMRNKTIPFLKILWRNHPEREATWETE